jgi:RNA polymerase sigma-70 factor (ECF subfamily)
MTESYGGAAVSPADGEIVRRIRAGDAEAFRVIVARYRQQYGKYAIAMTGDADTAADAMQESFIRAWKSLDACRDPDRFGPWFFRILTNQCHTARSRRKNTDPVDTIDLAARERTDEPLERSELAAQLASALARLTDEQREAFVLKHVDGRSYEEMSALLGTGVDALKMRVHRARDALRSMMGGMR